MNRHVVDGLAFAAAAVAGFLPQLLVWKAIYGRFFAVSPIGPQIRLWHPRLVDILWSSQNGLFATSPVLYVGAIGLLLLWRRDRLLAGCALLALAAMTWFNGCDPGLVGRRGVRQAPLRRDAPALRPRDRGGGWNDASRSSRGIPDGWWVLRA